MKDRSFRILLNSAAEGLKFRRGMVVNVTTSTMHPSYEYRVLLVQHDTMKLGPLYWYERLWRRLRRAWSRK